MDKDYKSTREKKRIDFGQEKKGFKLPFVVDTFSYFVVDIN